MVALSTIGNVGFFGGGRGENLEKPLEARVTTDYKIMKINNVSFLLRYHRKFTKPSS